MTGTSWRVRRSLTPAEYVAALTAIVTARSIGALVTDTARVVCDSLLADVGESTGDCGPHRPLDPGTLAVPVGQWTALMTAAACKAAVWRAAIDVALDLGARMPSSYRPYPVVGALRAVDRPKSADVIARHRRRHRIWNMR